MSWPNALKDQVLNHFFRASYTNSPDAASHIALFNGDPQDGGTELSGSGYARQAVTFAAPVNAPEGGRMVANSNELEYGPATANWAQASHWAAYTASSGGTLRASGELTSPRTLLEGDEARFAAGEIRVKLEPEAAA